MQTAKRSALRRAVRGSIWSLLFLVPALAQADWLILLSGVRVETKGHWTVKGKLIVYTSLDKSLRSIRLSEVDVEASTRASATEPASKPKRYQDLGEAPDIANAKPQVKFNRLDAWISNPNAPRVSGTVSAPGLRVSERDLVREGWRILEDPEAVEAELMQQAAQIDEQYRLCQQVRANSGYEEECGADYVRGAAALNQKVSEAYEAVEAARRSQERQEKLEKEDAAEASRIEKARAREEREAQAAANKKAPSPERPPG